MSTYKLLDNGELDDLSHMDESPVVAMGCCDTSGDVAVLANGRSFKFYDSAWAEQPPIPGTEAARLFERILAGRAEVPRVP